MSTFAEGVLASAVAAVITSTAFYGLALLMQKILLPWYRNVIYRGLHLGGSWFCLDPSMEQEIVLELKQKADRLSGTTTFAARSNELASDYEPLRTFAVEGSVRERLVTLVLHHIDRERLGVAVYLLEAVGDGRRLNGVFTFYNVIESRVDASFQTLWRDRAQAVRHLAEGLELQRQLTEEQQNKVEHADLSVFTQADAEEDEDNV